MAQLASVVATFRSSAMAGNATTSAKLSTWIINRATLSEPYRPNVVSARRSLSSRAVRPRSDSFATPARYAGLSGPDARNVDFMRLVLMTADAPHYHYFARELATYIDIDRIIVTPPVHAPARFHADHWLDEASEQTVFTAGLAGNWPGFDALAPVTRACGPNEPAVANLLTKRDCDVLLEIGTTIVRPHILEIPRIAALNIHGGNAETYRGVESRLWAIFNHDFGNLQTTLHVMDAHLDTGPIISQAAIPLSTGTAISDLALLAMDGALDMTVAALLGLERRGRFAVRPQLQRGRYYSWMPAVLKDEVVRIFDAHVATI